MKQKARRGKPPLLLSPRQKRVSARPTGSVLLSMAMVGTSQGLPRGLIMNVRPNQADKQDITLLLRSVTMSSESFDDSLAKLCEGGLSSIFLPHNHEDMSLQRVSEPPSSSHAHYHTSTPTITAHWTTFTVHNHTHITYALNI